MSDSWKKFYFERHMRSSAKSYTDRLCIAGKTLFGETISEIEIQNLHNNIGRLLTEAKTEFVGIIEVGCGTAITTEMLIELVPNIPIRAIDPIKENITVCKGLRLKHEGGIEFQIGEAQNIETLRPKNHLVFMYEVIQHMKRSDFAKFVDKCFSNDVHSIVCGGVPDIDQRIVFYEGRHTIPKLNGDADDVIGTWYSREFFVSLSSKIQVQYFDQLDLYTAPYRFDVILSQK